jgi:DNA-binding NtrC family response regulator
MSAAADQKNIIDLTGVRVLIADDQAEMRDLLRALLENSGARVREAADGAQALELAGDELDVALLDLEMPQMGGLECLRRIREKLPELQVIILSSEERPEVVVEAMKQGAYWYLSKRCSSDEILSLVAKAAGHAALTRDCGQLRGALSSSPLAPLLVGESSAALEVRAKAQRLAEIESTVLLSGESGTGKSLVARYIHQHSARAGQPFVTVSCAALPRDLLEAELFGHERGAFTGAVSTRPGRIELAHGGTLFLDEIGDLPLPLQPKLLVFLQEREVQRIGSNKSRRVDVRVIAATNQDLEEMCRARIFREDLYFRVNVLALELPPLRARADDIPGLAEHHLNRIARQRGLSAFKLDPGAAAALAAYHWPGNVRELENVLERASVFCEGQVVSAKDLGLPAAAPRRAAAEGPSLAGCTLEELERRAIVDAVKACGGNKAAAARMLGISEKGFYNKLQRHQLQAVLSGG